LGAFALTFHRISLNSSKRKDKITNMRLIAIKNLRNEAYQYPSAKKAVEAWYLVMKNSDWSSLEDI
jgi:hypothetical protein